MNIQDEFSDGLQKIENLYQFVFTDTYTGSAIFQAVCNRASMASEHDRNIIDAIGGSTDNQELHKLRIKVMGELLNFHTILQGKINFPLVISGLNGGKSNFDEYNENEWKTILDNAKTMRYHNIEAARSYFNVKLCDIIVGGDSEIPKEYLKLDERLVTKK